MENKNCTIDTIATLPTILGNTHESVLRSYNVLQYVTELLKRGDSRETILELLEYFGYHKFE